MSQEFDLSQGSQGSSQGDGRDGGGGGGGGGAHHRSARDDRDRDGGEYRSGGDSSDTGGDAWDDDGAAITAAAADDSTVVMRRSTAHSSPSSASRHRSRSARSGHPQLAPPPVVRYEDDQRVSKLREITLPSGSGAAAAAAAASSYGRASPATRIAPRGGFSPALSVAPSSAPLLAARLASPAPSSGYSTGAASPHLGLPSSSSGAPKMSAIQKALAAAKSAQPPPPPPPPPQQLQHASPSPPAVAAASSFMGGSESQQPRPDLDMTSPVVPAVPSEFPAFATSPFVGGMDAMAAGVAVAAARPIVPVYASATGLFSSQPYLGELTQYSQHSQHSQLDPVRPRLSAKSMVGPMPLVMPAAATAALEGVVDSARSSHKKRDKDKDKHGSSSSKSKKHSKKSTGKHSSKDKHHHKRAHSTSSHSGSSDAEAEDEKHKHKKKKNKHKHKSSSGVAAAAAIPGSSRVKLEPHSAAAVAASALPQRAPVSASSSSFAASASRSPPDFPQSDADFFSARLPTPLAASVRTAAATANLVAKSKATTNKWIASRETTIKDLAKANKKVSLSSSIGATLERDELRTSMIDDDVEEPSRSPLMSGAQGGAGGPHAKLTLSSAIITPPRRQRVTDLLSSKVGDDDDDEQAGAGAESWSGGGGGGSGSGDKRRGKGRGGKAGPLEERLKNLLLTRASNKRLKHQHHLHFAAANVLTGLPSPYNPDADSLVVRVLMAQVRYNVKFLLVSLCSPDVQTEHTMAPHSLLSPLSVLPTQVSEVCRAVAKASGLPFAAVPSSLLRIVMLPPSEFVEEGETASGHHEKLGDFPNCFLRIRQPFSYFRPEQCIPTIVNVRDWSRLLGDNERLAEQSEQQTWKDEQIRTDELMKADRAVEEVLDSVGAGGSRGIKNNAAAAMDDVARQASELQDPSGGFMTDLLGPSPAMAQAASAFESLSLDQAERVLDINEREWSVEDLIFHPSLRPDQHHDLLQEKQTDRMPLSTMRAFSNPVEMLVAGIVQKTNWRGVNIGPNLNAVEGEAEAPAARFSKIELPSFFVQDASGGVVEVEVPLSLLPNWRSLLARGLGCFVQLLQLRPSSSWRATHSSATMDSMQRSFQPWARDTGSFDRRDIVLLTVTDESSFRTSMPGVEAPLSVHVRRNAITHTPLLQIAKITSMVAAKRLGRVTLVGRVIHLENHALDTWRLHLTDESLKGSSLTSTMVIDLHAPFLHAIFDTFLDVSNHSLSSANTFKFVDVVVGFDQRLRVPTLLADEFTEIVKLTKAPKEMSNAAQLDKQEPMEILAFRRASKPIRKLNPFTRRLMMLPHHYHRALSVDRALDMPLTRLLQDGHILTPLVQKHAIFVIEGAIGAITMKPSVHPCCQYCLNLFPRYSSPRGVTLRRECMHCHQLTEIRPADPKCWLHYLQLPVLLDAVLPLATDESTLPRITMQFEATELQTLTSGWEEADKQMAFQNLRKLNDLLSGRTLPAMFPSLCSPVTNQGRPLSLLAPATASSLALQVATRLAQMQDEAPAAVYSQSQEFTGSQLSQGSNVDATGATQAHTQFEEVDM